MNFLAHAYLSFHQPAILAGNLISDFVKGKKQFDYVPGIQHGISLHRAIDHFTDNHPATRAAAAFYRPHYRLYSFAFIDVVYDHFLANDPNEFSASSLFEFSQEVYTMLDTWLPALPASFQQLFPYMKRQNWLYNYREQEGIANSFGGLVRRAAYLTDSQTALRLLEENYRPLQQYYEDFFPAVKLFARRQLEALQQ